MAENFKLPPPKSARRYALSLLAKREWGAQELRERMKQRGISEEAVEDALNFLQQHGLQSDSRFVASRSRMMASRKGNRAIINDLSHKGVEPELISAQVSQLADESERALQAVRRFEGKPLDEALKAKVWRFLASRGFGSDAVKQAMRHLATCAVECEVDEADEDAEN